jgi:hypothetical protein
MTGSAIEQGRGGNASQSRPTIVHEDYERQGHTSPFRAADQPTSRPASLPFPAAGLRVTLQTIRPVSDRLHLWDGRYTSPGVSETKPGAAHLPANELPRLPAINSTGRTDARTNNP